MYVAALASIGWAPLAVTDHQSQHQFRHKPPPGGLVAACHLLKLGKRLAAEGDEEPVAHARSTYSIPARDNALADGNIEPKL